jgi:tRNA(Ile)-lysidine synthase
LLRLSDSLADDYAFISSEIDRLWPTLAHPVPGGLSLGIVQLQRLPKAIRRHCLRHAVEQLLGDTAFYHMSHIDAMEAFLSMSPGKSMALPRGLSLEMGYGTIQFLKGDEVRPLPPTLKGEHPLSIPGTTQLAGWRVESHLTTKGEWPTDRRTAHLDADRVGTTVWARHRHPGDRFFPLGLAHEKKLQDFLVDFKVPRRQRDSIPIVCNPQGIVWVVGWRIDERFKVTDETQQVLAMRFITVPGSAANKC